MDSYHAGMFFGILMGIVVGFGLLALLFKKKVLDMHFDERQELARGKAFQYAFMTLIACAYLYGVSDVCIGRWCDVLTGVTICIALSIGVFAITCILKDAYLSLREKPGTIMTIFFLLAVMNLGLGGLYHHTGAIIENGVLTFRAVNPILGGTLLVILIVYIINFLLRDRKEED